MVEGKGCGPSPSRLSAFCQKSRGARRHWSAPWNRFASPYVPTFGAPPPRHLRRWLSARQDEARGTRAPPTAFDRSLPGTRLPIGGSLPDSSLPGADRDRKSTRLNSSHSQISYAVFCLKKKKNITTNY